MYRTPLTGSVYLINDLELATNGLLAPGTSVITLTEQPEYTMYIPNALKGTILLPPYEAMMALSDGNRQVFSQIYYSYLSATPEVDMLMTIICGAVLLRGMNILLFIPRDEMELDFFKDLSAFAYGVYGILIGTEQNPFAYQQYFDTVNLWKLYHGNYISAQDFILEYPANTPLDQPTCYKIVADLNIPIDPIYCEKWVNDYVNQIKQGGNAFRLKGVIKPCS